MKWNNGTERKLFEREQSRLRKEYLAAGMTEEQIQKMYEFDLQWFKSRRNETTHTQSLEIQTSEDEDEKMENPLYKKFLEKLAVVDKHSDYSRYGWIEEIEDKRLYIALSSLSTSDKELLTKYFYDGFSQAEIAVCKGINQSNISRKFARLKKILKNIL